MKNRKLHVSRITVLLIFMLVASSTIFSKLLELQVMKGEEYRERSDTGSVRTLNVPAPRGKILDRNNLVLADNVISYSIIYNQAAETELYFYPTIDKLMNILSENGEKLKDDFQIKYDEKSQDPYVFIFPTSDETSKRNLELIFKKDNGMEQKAIADLDIKKTPLTEDQKKSVDQKLLEYSAKETYEYIRDEILHISYESFFLDICNLYKSDREKSFEYFMKYFNINANSEEFKKIMSGYNGSYKEGEYSEDIKALIESLGLKNKKFDKEKERAFVIIKAAMRLQMFSGFSPIVLSNDVKEVTSTIVNQKLFDMPGVEIDKKPVRSYPFGTLASNVIGHLSSIDALNSERYKLKGYEISKDYIGALGIEKAFEDDLRGDIGGRVVKFNEYGRVVSNLGSMAPLLGNDIQLTINKDVEYAAEKSLQAVMNRMQKHGFAFYDNANTGNATRGAAVLINIKTGEIIACASLPGFDPNDFAAPGKLTIDKANEYFNVDYEKAYKDFVKKMGIVKSIDDIFPIDEETGARYDPRDILPKPFFNYATMTLTPPGSTFKPLTAIAGLSEGIDITYPNFRGPLTVHSTIYDALQYTRYPGGQFRDWNSASFGEVNVTHAIESSINYYFFAVGDFLQEQRGFNKLAEYAWKFGLGSDPTKNENNSTGIEIEEYFGQTYNDISYRNRHTNGTLIPKIYDQMLLDTNIDLHVKDEDSNEIKKIKEDLRGEMAYQIKNDLVETERGKIYDLFRDLCMKNNISENLDYNYNYLINQLELKISESRLVGHVLNASIGQGENMYTPLQLAVYMATLANKGERKSVHLVKNILDPNGKIIESFSSETLSTIEIKPEIYDAILEGMKEVNYGEDGTVSEGVFDDFPIKIAGKTGSATVSDTEESFGRTGFAVYTGFAPADDPEVAISVVIFDGAHGGVVAPVALRMLEAYFKDELKAQNYIPKKLQNYDDEMNSFMNEIYNK